MIDPERPEIGIRIAEINQTSNDIAMKKVAPASKEASQAYERICKNMSARGAERGGMFGMPVLKKEGKAFAGLFGDAMVFKLADEAHRAASELAGAEAFDPSGMKRPMKAWIVLPARHCSRWPAFVQAALAATETGIGAHNKKKT